MFYEWGGGTKYLILFVFILCCCPFLHSQTAKQFLSLHYVVDTLSLNSPSAEIERMNFQNENLQFQNYKKSFLPSLSFNISPINLNRSLKLLQSPNDGNYYNVEDYTNNSSFGITLGKTIGLTGGQLSINSGLNILNEFSSKRTSFSTTPFSVSYSQQLFGGGKKNKFDKQIKFAKNSILIKEYSAKISNIQKTTLGLYLNALQSKMEVDFSQKNKLYNDTLFNIAKQKVKNGSITQYDFNKIDIQRLNTIYTYEKSISNYNENIQNLKTYLGIDSILIELLDPKIELPFQIDSTTIINNIKQNNPFYNQQKIRLLEAKSKLYSAKLDNSFNGNVSLSYGTNQYSQSFIGAYKKPNDRQSLSVGLQIPIFQWGVTKNRLAIAKNEFNIAEISINKMISDFEFTISKNINNYYHSFNMWLVSEQSYKLSLMQYNLLIKRFEMGKVSVYEIVEEQKNIMQLLRQYFLCIKDLYNSYYTIRDMSLFDYKVNQSLEELYNYFLK